MNKATWYKSRGNWVAILTVVAFALEQTIDLLSSGQEVTVGAVIAIVLTILKMKPSQNYGNN